MDSSGADSPGPGICVLHVALYWVLGTVMPGVGTVCILWAQQRGMLMRCDFFSHACLHTCSAYVRTHVYGHVCEHAYMPTCLHAYMPTGLQAYRPPGLQAYMPTCLQAYMPTGVGLQAYRPTCLHAYMPTCLRAHSK